MNKTIYKLKRIEFENFNPKEAKVTLKIGFTKNDNYETLLKDIELKNPINIVNTLILGLKKKDKIIIDEPDDFLQTIYITRIENEEEVEEKLLNFFQNICSKVQNLRKIKEANEYMRIYNELKITKLIF